MTIKNRYQLLDAIHDAESDVEEFSRKYLALTGWTSTCKTPGSYWMWTKTLPDGRHLMGGADMAISFQRNLDDDEEPRPDSDEAEC